MADYSDSFTGANGSAPNGSWTIEKSNAGDTLDIQSNQLRFLTSGGNDFYMTRDSGIDESDQTILGIYSTTGSPLWGLVAHYASTSVRYRLRRSNLVDNLQLYKSGSLVGSFNLTGLYNGNFMLRLRVTVSGSDRLVQGKIWLASGGEPGTWNIEYTDTTPLAAGKCGVYGDVNNGSILFDNYVLDDLDGGGGGGGGPVAGDLIIDRMPTPTDGFYVAGYTATYA